MKIIITVFSVFFLIGTGCNVFCQVKGEFVPIEKAYNRTSSIDNQAANQNQPQELTTKTDDSSTSQEKPTIKEATKENSVEGQAENTIKDDSQKTETDQNQAEAVSEPLMEIKKINDEEALFSIELRDVALGDLFRVLAHNYNLNILVDKSVVGTVSASFTNIALEEALERIAEMQNLVLEKKGNVIMVKPNLTSRVFKLKYINAREITGAAATPAQ